MGCEGGVVVYDADKIEAHFGSDVWERSGWGRVHSMPVVTIDAGSDHARRILVTDWTSGLDWDREDHFEAAREDKWHRDERGRPIEKHPSWGPSGYDDLEFAMEVAVWARENAFIDNVETWT
jgi:hypothetical protein